MSYSLQIQNGDLLIGGATLGVVKGSAKLIQDLRCAILERMGTDDAHPGYGSLIDGGRLNGQEQPSMIASSDWGRAVTVIESEIRRIATQYQNAQITRLRADKSTYGKPTLTPDELLMGISSIQFFQAQDNLLVKIGLTTGSNNTLNINIPLGMQTV